MEVPLPDRRLVKFNLTPIYTLLINRDEVLLSGMVLLFSKAASEKYARAVKLDETAKH